MESVLRILVVVLVLPSAALAQYVDPMTGNGRAEDYARARPMNLLRDDPIITEVELRGPLPAPSFQSVFKLTDEQTGLYAAVLDSFTTVTKAEREDARHRVEQLGAAITKRDSAAAEYYRDHLKLLGKSLKAAQSRFDERLKKLLTKDQEKEYRTYRKKQDEAARAAPPGTKGSSPR